MSKHMTLPLATALSITATGTGDPIRLNVSPFLGGQGRNALLVNQTALAGGGVIAIEGNPALGSDAPADNDAGWAVIATLDADAPSIQEIELPSWIRTNITTVGTGTANIVLEGVQ